MTSFKMDDTVYRNLRWCWHRHIVGKLGQYVAPCVAKTSAAMVMNSDKLDGLAHDCSNSIVSVLTMQIRTNSTKWNVQMLLILTMLFTLDT